MEQTAHWTSRGVDAFIHRITFDFITQLSKRLDASPMNQSDLAKKLKLTESSVSQVLNSPRNLTLRTIVKYARALGLKVALVAYDDEDHENNRGPINSEIFNICWEQAKRPTDFLSLKTESHNVMAYTTNRDYVKVPTVRGESMYLFNTGTNNPSGIQPEDIERLMDVNGSSLKESQITRGLIRTNKGESFINLPQQRGRQ